MKISSIQEEVGGYARHSRSLALLGNLNKVLVEKPHIVAQRLAFYANKKRLEENGFTLVYVDERWIDTSFTAKRLWLSVD